MDQGHRHAGIRNVEQAALPFNVIPVICIIVRCQVLNRAGHEISNHSIKRHATTGDQNTRLTCGAERRLHTTLAHFRIHAQTSVHLAHRAICADSQTTLTCALFAVSNRVSNRRDTYVEQRAAIHAGSGHQLVFVTQQIMQARRDVIAKLQRFHEDLFPRVRNHTATVGHTNHECFRTSSQTFFKCHVRQTDIRTAAFHTELANRVFRAPISNAARHFCCKLIRGIAEEQKVRCLNHFRISIFFTYPRFGARYSP